VTATAELSYTEIWEARSYIASTLAIILAAIGGLGAFIKYLRDVKNQRIQAAYDKYDDFLSFAIQHKEFAYRWWDTHDPTDKINQGGYYYFAAKMLWSCGEILRTPGLDPSWLETVKIVLGDHRDYLASEEFQVEKSANDPRLIELIDQVVDAYKREVAGDA